MQAKRERGARPRGGAAWAPRPGQGRQGTDGGKGDRAAGGGNGSDGQGRPGPSTEEAKVTAIPLSAFYAEDCPAPVARFCFSKQDTILDEAVARLGAFFGRG